MSDLIDRNYPGHPGIEQALKEIDSFLKYVSKHPEIPWEIDRLNWSSKVSPLVILKEAAAVTLLNYRTSDYVHNRAFVNHTAFIRCLGWRVLCLVPYEKRQSSKGTEYIHVPRKKPRQVLGEFLWSRLGRLLVNIAKTILTRAERERKKEEVYNQPLT